MNQNNDPLLELYINLAEQGIGFGVTLMTPGFIVSGDIISLSSYLEELRNSVQSFSGRESNASSAVREGLVSGFDRFLETSKSNQVSSDDVEDSDDVEHLYQHIHLNNVEIICGNNNLKDLTPPVWRISTSSISGFALGYPSRAS